MTPILVNLFVPDYEGEDGLYEAKIQSILDAIEYLEEKFGREDDRMEDIGSVPTADKVYPSRASRYAQTSVTELDRANKLKNGLFTALDEMLKRYNNAAIAKNMASRARFEHFDSFMTFDELMRESGNSNKNSKKKVPKKNSKK